MQKILIIYHLLLIIDKLCMILFNFQAIVAFVNSIWTQNNHCITKLQQAFIYKGTINHKHL